MLASQVKTLKILSENVIVSLTVKFAKTDALDDNWNVSTFPVLLIFPVLVIFPEVKLFKLKLFICSEAVDEDLNNLLLPESYFI